MKNEMKNFLSAATFEGPIMNSDNAVFLFTVKNGEKARKSLIKTGLFDGNEEFIRLRVSSTYGKMDTNQYAVIKRNGESYSWQSGGGSNTLVSDQMNAMAKLISETIDVKICGNFFPSNVQGKLSEIRKEDFFKKFTF